MGEGGLQGRTTAISSYSIVTDACAALFECGGLVQWARDESLKSSD